MKTRSRIVFSAIAVIAMILIGAAAHAADPQLETNDDILLGRWTLNPVDDLVVANPLFQNLSIQMRQLPFFTDNNFISNAQSVGNVGTTYALNHTA